jgi:iron only hydrogenase large subunit-like protein
MPESTEVAEMSELIKILRTECHCSTGCLYSVVVIVIEQEFSVCLLQYTLLCSVFYFCRENHQKRREHWR